MARGQDAPIRQGGGVDPYIQQSLSQGKQQANSRLIAAMQEAGAMDQARVSSATQIQTTASRGRTQRDVTAAQQEGADRRAAEAERGRRSDREFAKFMEQERQQFEVEQSALVREQQVADREDQRDYSEELQLKIDARQDLFDLMTRKEARANRNATLSLFKGSIGREEGMEKFKTNFIKTKEEYDRNSAAYDSLVTDTVAGLNDDDNLKLPLQGEFKSVAKPVGATMGFVSGFTRVQEAVPDTKPNPQAAIQKQMTYNEVSFSAEDTTPEKIHVLEEKIIEGSATSEDVRSFLGIAEAGIAYWKEREDAEGASEEDQKFSRQSRRDLQAQQRAVIGLRKRSGKKLKGSNTLNVATVITDALGPTHQKYAPSFGADLAEFQAKMGTDYRAILEDATKFFNPDESLEIPEGATPDLIEQINKANARMATMFSE